MDTKRREKLFHAATNDVPILLPDGTTMSVRELRALLADSEALEKIKPMPELWRKKADPLTWMVECICNEVEKALGRD